MKKNNHHYIYRTKSLKVGDIVHIHHSMDYSIEIITKEWQGAWKTLCICENSAGSDWEGKQFTLEKNSDRVYDVEHSKLIRILYGYDTED